jgi:Protein of unknown function (DUF2934)
MSTSLDRDGKSKTASAVDADHYPDGDSKAAHAEANSPAQVDIEKLAFHLWEQRGRPAGSHEDDWLEAERQLREAQGQSKVAADQAGSVQR